MCYHPIVLDSRRTVPCGHCLACIKSQRNSWIVRLTEEFKSSTSAYFVTLTYSDDNVPISDGLKVLRPSDTQLFLKRFRKQLARYDVKLRYFLVGEYGSRTLRPHYHFLAFFTKPFSLSVVTQLLLKAWTSGFVTVSEVTSARVAYCCKYVNMVASLPSCYDSHKPFRRMSLGIGRSYLSDNIKEYHRSGLNFSHDIIKNNLYVMPNGFKYSLPRYYRDRVYSFSERAFIRYQLQAKAASDFTQYVYESEQVSKVLNYDTKNNKNSHGCFQDLENSLSAIRSQEEELRRYLGTITKSAKI